MAIEEQVDNRTYLNTAPQSDLPGLVTLVHGYSYRLVVEHAEYRHRGLPQGRQKTEHQHDVYHIVLVSGGRGAFRIGGELCEVTRGDLFLTSPGQPHCFGPSQDETTEYCEVTFAFCNPQGEALTLPFHEAMQTWLRRPCAAIKRTLVGEKLHTFLVKEIENLVRSGFAGLTDVHLHLNVALQKILLGIYTHLLCADSILERTTPLRTVHDYLHQHYNQPVRLADLADLTGMTANYISRRFKQEYGLTPIVYQYQLRIKAACRLLTTTDDSIQRIAATVGFEDIYYFSRRFRKIQGMPPGRYRKHLARERCGGNDLPPFLPPP